MIRAEIRDPEWSPLGPRSATCLRRSFGGDDKGVGLFSPHPLPPHQSLRVFGIVLLVFDEGPQQIHFCLGFFTVGQAENVAIEKRHIGKAIGGADGVVG